MASTKSQVEDSEVGSDTVEPISLSDPPEVEYESHKSEVGTNVHKESNILVALWENLVGVKRVAEDRWLKYCSGGRVNRTRAYQVWPGNNVFFFRGQLICGPDPRGLVLTAVAISLSSWIFAVYVAREFLNRSSLIIILSVVLTAIVLANLVVVGMIDPGIIPRNDQLYIEEIGTGNRTNKRRIAVNGVEGDSAEVLSSISQQKQDLGPLEVTLDDIRNAALGFRLIEYRAVRHTDNWVAHHLAKVLLSFLIGMYGWS
ncbi:hypothetical protein Acr_01g0008130 [Actinidia rufa]|uniref:DHHC-type zinc finger family protein n=1 Tax=Actinidia rufa TaxID=165716 RepID=A0A7J0E3C7_9ERIC|nr:hypothetical protein Acr_01g0008130 [Actinidia rufa]